MSSRFSTQPQPGEAASYGATATSRAVSRATSPTRAHRTPREIENNGTDGDAAAQGAEPSATTPLIPKEKVYKQFKEIWVLCAGLWIA